MSQTDLMLKLSFITCFNQENDAMIVQMFFSKWDLKRSSYAPITKTQFILIRLFLNLADVFNMKCYVQKELMIQRRQKVTTVTNSTFLNHLF